MYQEVNNQHMKKKVENSQKTNGQWLKVKTKHIY